MNTQFFLLTHLINLLEIPCIPARINHILHCAWSLLWFLNILSKYLQIVSNCFFELFFKVTIMRFRLPECRVGTLFIDELYPYATVKNVQ